MKPLSHWSESKHRNWANPKAEQVFVSQKLYFTLSQKPESKSIILILILYKFLLDLNYLYIWKNNATQIKEIPKQVMYIYTA
jgi:hypothetical protein